MARRRLDTKQAAQALGISMDAVRTRASRGQLAADKGADGKLYIWLDTDTPEQDKDDRDMLIEVLRDQLARAEERDRENRRIIAALTQRIPALEPPDTSSPEPPGSPQTVSEEPSGTQEDPPEEGKRSWWRRLIEG
jgi:hypothetical protein